MRRCGRDARTTAAICTRTRAAICTRTGRTGDGPGTVGVDGVGGVMSRRVGVGETPTPRPGDGRGAAGREMGARREAGRWARGGRPGDGRAA